jgi:hypothetical protein
LFDITLDEEVMWEVAIGKPVVSVDMVATKQLFGKYTQYRLKYPYDGLRVNWRKRRRLRSISSGHLHRLA